jgi:hypothetical protein
LAHTFVVVGQGVLVGIHGPPEHASVQSQPLQEDTCFSGCCWKYHCDTACASDMPSTVKEYQSALQDRQCTRHEELYTPQLPGTCDSICSVAV